MSEELLRLAAAWKQRAGEAESRLAAGRAKCLARIAELENQKGLATLSGEDNYYDRCEAGIQNLRLALEAFGEAVADADARPSTSKAAAAAGVGYSPSESGGKE